MWMKNENKLSSHRSNLNYSILISTQNNSKMKKFSLALGFAAFAMIGLSSCGETCVECTYEFIGVSATEEFCSEESDLVDAFEATILAIDANAVCN
ncbi:MAG: hypothetical protein ACI959_000364 [Limisphaerales bacterium]|jgi:hypothetical protein